MDDDPAGISEDGTDAVADRSIRDQLLAIVLEKGYRRHEQPFLLSSGATSHDYVDLRRAVSRGGDLELAARAVLAHLEQLGIGFDAIGGMTMGADPVAHASALVGSRSWFSVRKAEKSHGSRQRIEGAPLGPGVKAVVFEDTVSTGASLAEAFEVVRSTGADVVSCCTILDRGELASARLERASVPYSSILTYKDLGIEPLSSPPGQPPSGLPVEPLSSPPGQPPSGLPVEPLSSPPGGPLSGDGSPPRGSPT